MQRVEGFSMTFLRSFNLLVEDTEKGVGCGFCVVYMQARDSQFAILHINEFFFNNIVQKIWVLCSHLSISN